jgi:hypothetical protein
MIRQSFTGGTKHASVEMQAGQLSLRELQLGFDAAHADVNLAGARVEATTELVGGATLLRFAPPILIRASECLTVDTWGP